MKNLPRFAVLVFVFTLTTPSQSQDEATTSAQATDVSAEVYLTILHAKKKEFLQRYQASDDIDVLAQYESNARQHAAAASSPACETAEASLWIAGAQYGASHVAKQRFAEAVARCNKIK